jgi:hypothetical protein
MQRFGPKAARSNYLFFQGKREDTVGHTHKFIRGGDRRA